MRPFWKGRRVFVTGATGVIGSWLVKELLRFGSEVVVLVMDPDPRSELYRSGDIGRTRVVQGRLEELRTLERAVNEHEIDTVFHLGAQTLVEAAHRAPLLTMEANIRGTYHMLEVCRLHANLVKRVVVASSDKAYGEHDDLPYREDMTLKGRHPYEVSKTCADLLAQSYHHTYGVPVAIVRCGNVYGGGDLNWSRIVPGTMASLFQGQRPVIRSDGKYVRDYIYVKDVARAYLRVAECLDQKMVQGEAFNFGTERPVRVMELVQEIQKLMKQERLAPDVRNSATGEIRDQYLSADKAKRLLEWVPEYDLHKGLDETADWYRDFLEVVEAGR